MANKTLSELITYSRQIADAQNTNFVTDEELVARVNEAVLELYDKIVLAYQYYYTSSATFTLTSACNKAQLPDDFYKDLGLDLISNSGSPTRPITIHRYGSFIDRNSQGWCHYMIQGSDPGVLVVQPAANATGTYTFWYTPNVPLLVEDGDTIDQNLSRWYEFIVLQVAIGIMNKREQDAGQLIAKVVHLSHQIDSAAANRMAEPQTIPVHYTGNNWWGGYGSGNGNY